MRAEQSECIEEKLCDTRTDGGLPIVAVYTDNGTKLVSYAYDAWGNHTISYHNGGENTPAQYNPFRYRSYYYDTDLGLYYLNSRYYDSVVGRFISADSYVSTGQGLTGQNMFAYCNNNPVMHVDSEGNFPWLILIFLVASAAVGGYLGATSKTQLAANEPKPKNDILDENDSASNIEQNKTSSNNENIANDSTKEDLSTTDVIKNTIIGAGIGLAMGGAIIATGGVAVGAIKGIGAAYLGVNALQGFAIGALAYNTSACLVLPIFCIEIEPIEYETPSEIHLP